MVGKIPPLGQYVVRESKNDCEYNEDDNIITDDELADCDTPDETWREGGIKD